MNGELALVSDTINHALPHLGKCQIAYSIASQCRKARFCQAAGVMGLLLLLIHLSGRGRTFGSGSSGCVEFNFGILPPPNTVVHGARSSSLVTQGLYSAWVCASVSQPNKWQ